MNKQRISLVIGVTFAFISMLFEGLRLAWADSFRSFIVTLTFVALVLLISQKTRAVGKNFLKGYFLTLIAVVVVGFTGTLLIAFLSK